MLKPILFLSTMLFSSLSFGNEDPVIKMINTNSTPEKFEVPSTKTVYQVGPNSKLKIEYQEKKEKAELFQGSVRVRVKKNNDGSSKNEPKLELKTTSSNMGVRGTDFLAISTPLLNESEIIVFEGKVEFTSLMNNKDSKLVTAGQWGGVGGRFGFNTHELINLPKDALKHFDATSSIEDEKNNKTKTGK